ncbi:MAG: hypothetical protein RIQ60_3526 [Pseudomonadota bacterium]|jgi:signal transduction histidine kinase
MTRQHLLPQTTSHDPRPDAPAGGLQLPDSSVADLRVLQGYRTLHIGVWLVAALLLALTWLHIVQLVADSRSRELDAAARDLANLTRVSEEHAERTLRSADQVIQFVKERYLAEGDKLDLIGLTQRGVIEAEHFNQVGVIDAHGLYALANRPITGRLDLSDREHFKVHLTAERGELFVSRPLTGRATGKWSIQMTRRISRADGSFAGVVVVSMDPHYFGSFYSDLNLGQNGLAALYGMDGVARARRVGRLVEFGADASSSQMYRRIAAGQTAGSYVDVSMIDGVERIVHFRKLPHYPLVVVAGQALVDVYANHNRTRDALLLQGGMVSVLLLALAAALSRYLRQMRRDLQARQAAQQQVRDRTEQLNAVFALSPDGFVTFDPARRLQFVNPAFLKMTRAAVAGGPTDSGAAGDPVGLTGLDEAGFVAWLTGACQAGSDTTVLARLAALKPSAAMADDTRAPGAGRLSTITLSGAGSRVLQVDARLSDADSVSKVYYFRDVTRETEVDQIKSEFLSTAAHELRTPMASIYGFSEVLVSTEIEAAEQKEFLGIIYEQSKAMARILDELLDLARMEARRGKDFKLVPLDLNTLVAEVVRSYKYPAGRAMAELHLHAEPVPLLADAGKLAQAVLNVLSNAYKYSPRGGPVGVSVLAGLRAPTDPPGIALRACVRISDTGIGMTEEQVGRVCERFYRVDKSGTLPGTGLGMSIVKEIIELHHGTLDIASTPGQGSCISLYLSLAAPLPVHPPTLGVVDAAEAADMVDPAVPALARA